MRYRTIAPLVAAWCLTMLLAGAAGAGTLIGSPFITGYDGWTDTNTGTITVAGSLPLWGVLINNDALCDVSDGAPSNGGTYGGGTAGDSQYEGWMIVNSNYATPSKYTLTGTLSSVDDDGLGLIFAYKDNDNYMRVGMRQQGTGSYGCPQGLTLDKVVGGVITQVVLDSTATYAIDNSLFTVKIEVDGTACTVYGPNAVVASYSGSIAELTDLGHNYGFMNWRSGSGGNNKRFFGAQLHSLAVDNSSDGSVDRNHTFENVSPLPWREVNMTNAEGAQVTLEFDKGNFRVEMANQGIVDDTNPYVDGTATAPHTDFIGSAIAIDDVDTLAMENYQMQVRMECADNEGPGLLVRVTDDKTFYRVNFAAEAVDTGSLRPKQGMSIQKCDGRAGGTPVWTELFSESSTPFCYTNHTDDGETFPFDVKVIVTNNADDTATTIRVEVIDDPEELATPYVWEAVDSSNPILTGTVGFANYAAGTLGYNRTLGVRWSGYGGDVNAPLVLETTVVIPEIPGDADRDGDVDDDDAADMAAAWGTASGATWAMGDFDKDGDVDAGDASIMAANWGYVYTPGEGATAVPEPGMIALLLAAMATLAVERRRN